MGGLMVRFFPLAVEDLSCPDLTELPRSPRARLRPPTEAAESIKKLNIFCQNSLKMASPSVKNVRFSDISMRKSSTRLIRPQTEAAESTGCLIVKRWKLNGSEG